MSTPWRDDRAESVSDQAPAVCDDVVIGAGITGLMCALLLARAGRSVVVLEARDVGGATTGSTTGKVSVLQGTRLSDLLGQHPEDVVRAYLTANLEGLSWLQRYGQEHGLDMPVRSAATYAPDAEATLEQVRAEYDAATRLGLDARWATDLPVPFPHYGAVVVDEQTQVQPMQLLDQLVLDVRANGGLVVTGARVDRVSVAGPPTVRFGSGQTLQCDNVIGATGTPTLDRGLYFAKLRAHRSYALAYAHPRPPELMLLAAGSDTRSIRDAGTPDDPLLLVGGAGHRVGHARSEREHLDTLRRWTSEHFPEATETHHWSAQDYLSHDGIPYVGALPRGGGHLYLATGYAKWGLTNGVAAALSITASILGGKLPWADRLGRRVTRPGPAAQVLTTNAGVVIQAARGVVGAAVTSLPDQVDEGQGVVGRRRGRPCGLATVDGQQHAVSALCTHLGGVVAWNDLEKSWDCPLHGSRFAADGEVLEGPATRPLPRTGA